MPCVPLLPDRCLHFNCLLFCLQGCRRAGKEKSGGRAARILAVLPPFWGSKPHLWNPAKTGQYLIHPVPKFFLFLENILQIRVVDIPGLMHTACHLVDVVAGAPQEGEQFGKLRQIQLHDISVHRHLAEIYPQVVRAELGHLLADQFPLMLRHHEMKLHRPFPVRHQRASRSGFLFFSVPGACFAAAFWRFSRTDWRGFGAVRLLSSSLRSCWECPFWSSVPGTAVGRCSVSAFMTASARQTTVCGEGQI